MFELFGDGVFCVVIFSSLSQVYSLMGKRLRYLCSPLDISDELRLKIWTCFEHSLVHCTELMKDRHLDQLLMCAIYIIAKVGSDGSERSLDILCVDLINMLG